MTPPHKAPMTRAVSRALDGWLRHHIATARQPLGLAIVIGAFCGVILVPEAWLLARIVTGAVFQHQPLHALLPFGAELLGLYLLRAVITRLGTIAAVNASLRVKSGIRRRLHKKLETLGSAFLAEQRTGDLVSLIVEGVDALDKYFAAYLPQMAISAFVPVTILAVAFSTDWVSGVLLLVAGPIIPVFMVIIGKGTERLNQTHWRRLALMTAHFFDVIEGLTTLKLFGAARREAKIIRQVSDDYRVSAMNVLRVAFLSSLVLEFFSTLGMAMIAVFIGFRLYYGELHFLSGLFVLLLAPEFFRPLRAMGTQYHARMEAIAAAERIVALLDTPGAIVAVPRVLPSDAIDTIQCVRVGFAYRPDEPALQDISFTLRKGEHVALVGPSGSGKSTVGRLLLGLATPAEGQILVNGENLDGILPEAWLQRVSWLPQRPTLFPGSIAENIRLGRADATMDDLVRAATAAAAHEFICRLPQGYDTVIGERGQGLSGGELRRLALARALLKPAQLLVLDEADASLDHDTANLVRDAIACLPADTTVLFIGHRLESAEAADRIIVLDHGRIAEQGSHGLLRAASGKFAAMDAAYRDGVR